MPFKGKKFPTEVGIPNLACSVVTSCDESLTVRTIFKLDVTCLRFCWRRSVSEEEYGPWEFYRVRKIDLSWIRAYQWVLNSRYDYISAGLLLIRFLSWGFLLSGMIGSSITISSTSSSTFVLKLSGMNGFFVLGREIQEIDGLGFVFTIASDVF